MAIVIPHFLMPDMLKKFKHYGHYVFMFQFLYTGFTFAINKCR